MFEICMVYGFFALIFLLMLWGLTRWGLAHRKLEQSLQALADKRGISKEEVRALAYEQMFKWMCEKEPSDG